MKLLLKPFCVQESDKITVTLNFESFFPIFRFHDSCNVCICNYVLDLASRGILRGVWRSKNNKPGAKRRKHEDSQNFRQRRHGKKNKRGE